MFIKFLIVAVCGYLLFQVGKKLLKGKINKMFGGALGGNPFQNQPGKIEGELRECDLCGTYADPKVGFMRGHKFYCSMDCVENRKKGKPDPEV